MTIIETGEWIYRKPIVEEKEEIEE